MKSLLRTLNGEIRNTPPLWLMRQAGRYLPEYRKIREQSSSFLELCYTPKLAAEITLQPIKRFGFDAAILFSDILVVPHALGQPLCYVEGKGPVLEPLIELTKLDFVKVESHLEPIFRTIELVKENLPDDVTLIGFAGAPWTVAAYMIEGGASREFEKVRRVSLKEEETFENLIDILVEVTLFYLGGQIKSGAEVIQLFDSWAGILPPAQFHKWAIEPTRKIVAGLKQSHPHVPVIGFPKGAGNNLPEYVEKTGVDAVGLDYAVPCRWVNDALEKKIPVQGNLDPAILSASLKETVLETKRIMKEFSGRPHIMNLGHGILPETPIEHVHAMVEAVRES